MSEPHDHDHPHHHDHPDLAHLPSDPALRVKAMESLLLEKGLVNADTIDAYVDKLDRKSVV